MSTGSAWRAPRAVLKSMEACLLNYSRLQVVIVLVLDDLISLFAQRDEYHDLFNAIMIKETLSSPGYNELGLAVFLGSIKARSHSG